MQKYCFLSVFLKFNSKIRKNDIGNRSHRFGGRKFIVASAAAK